MAESNDGGGQPAPAPIKPATDLSALTQQVEKLSADLTKANSQVESLQGQLGEVVKERDSFKSANGQLNTDMTNVTAQMKQFQEQAEQQAGQITNWETQFNQLNAQFAETGQNLTGTQQELDMYKLIASDPKYHHLVGAVNNIKVAPTAEEQKAVLDQMAAWTGQQQKSWQQNFQAGATPPAGGQPPGQPAQPGQNANLPTTIPEVHQLMQMTNPRSPEYAQLRNQLNTLQYGQPQTGQQN